jgi:hypothetical protein
MSIHIVGFREPDDEWRKMKAAYDACEAAGIEIPPEIDRFFDGEKPDERGIEIDLEPHTKEFHTEAALGYEIEVADIPKQIKVLRFYNSW